MKSALIRPWRTGDSALVEAALGTPDVLRLQSRSLLGRDPGDPGWQRVMVAESHGRLVGVALVHTSMWHPRRLWADVEVSPGHRRRGIGSALLEALRAAAAEDGRPLRAKVFAHSPGAAFAAALGFAVIQRSREFALPTTTAGPGAIGNLVVATDARPDTVADAFAAFYLKSHNWDPPGPITAGDFLRSHVDDACDRILVCGQDGEPRAVGLVYDEGEGLVLSGGDCAPDAAAAVAAMLDAAHHRADARDRTLAVEADDSCPSLVTELERRGATFVEEVLIVADG